MMWCLRRFTQGVSSAASDVYKRQSLLVLELKLIVGLGVCFIFFNWFCFTIWILFNSSFNLKVQARQLLVVLFPVSHKVSGSFEKPHVLCVDTCLLYTSPSPRDLSTSRMPSSA
eukprot:TRINITY_DN71702_c0_g1_i1.p2 TRINITY_DN71702_c0_g1~~TRINITY_DN71702_c0_g1_i1.p2  ORF type:complete len:114 (-),score=8.21 TRINITY_DN71702_c0_g1_i1:78-419(-)